MNMYKLRELLGNGEYAKALDYVEYWQSHSEVFKSTLKWYRDYILEKLEA